MSAVYKVTMFVSTSTSVSHDLMMSRDLQVSRLHGGRRDCSPAAAVLDYSAAAGALPAAAAQLYRSPPYPAPGPGSLTAAPAVKSPAGTSGSDDESSYDGPLTASAPAAAAAAGQHTALLCPHPSAWASWNSAISAGLSWVLLMLQHCAHSGASTPYKRWSKYTMKNRGEVFAGT